MSNVAGVGGKGAFTAAADVEKFHSRCASGLADSRCVDRDY
jgi:hypothetical protein